MLAETVLLNMFLDQFSKDTYLTNYLLPYYI